MGLPNSRMAITFRRGSNWSASPTAVNVTPLEVFLPLSRVCHRSQSGSELCSPFAPDSLEALTVSRFVLLKNETEGTLEEERIDFTS